jgi:hypothetical protein
LGFLFSSKLINSISKFKVELAGILPIFYPPYPYSGEILKMDFSPTFIDYTPRSQPLMTSPAPNSKENAVSLAVFESNSVPSSKVPVYVIFTVLYGRGVYPVPSFIIVLFN